MLTPTIDASLLDVTNEPSPSLGYGLDTQRGRVRGIVDELAAVQQAIIMILASEQGEHLIYNAGYGLKVADLIGKPFGYVTSELTRRIKAALLADERIQAVHSFTASSSSDELTLRFTIDCIFGTFQAQKEVPL